MPSSTYDVVVLGDELAGLVSATLCASRGLRVLLVESGTRRCGYQLGPFRLPEAPLPLHGLTSPAATRVIEELHFQHLLKRKLADGEHTAQVVGPDARVALAADPMELAQELARELPGSEGSTLADAADRIAEAVDALFSADLAVPPTGFFERREIGRIDDRIAAASDAFDLEAAPAPLAALLRLPAAASAHQLAADLPPAAVARALAAWRRGVPRLPGDLEALREIFLDKFTSHNGERREGRAHELLVGWNKVTGVRLDDGDEIGASHLIAAMPVGDLVPLFGKKVPKRLRQLDDAIEPAGYRYTLHVIVDAIAVPEGMGDAVVCAFDPDAPLALDNALALYLDRLDDRARVVVSAQAALPAPPDGTSLEVAFAALRRRVRDRMAEIMPFAESHVLAVHSPLEAAPAEGYGEPTLPPSPPPPLWRCDLEAEALLAALPSSVGVKQLSLASSQILPALGLEGELAAGWSAARLACAAGGKKRDYLKGEAIAQSR